MRHEGIERSNGLIIDDRELVIARSVELDQTVRGSRALLTFPRRILTLCETTSTWTARIGDETLKSGSTYNDFYGFFTSFDEPLAAARAAASRYGPAVLVEAVVSIERFPGAYVDPEDARSSCMPPLRHNHPYQPIPHDWIDVSTSEKLEAAQKWHAAPAADRGEHSPSFLLREKRADEVVLWSSAVGDEENLLRLESLLREHCSVLGEAELERRLDRARAAAGRAAAA